MLTGARTAALLTAIAHPPMLTDTSPATLLAVIALKPMLTDARPAAVVATIAPMLTALYLLTAALGPAVGRPSILTTPTTAVVA